MPNIEWIGPKGSDTEHCSVQDVGCWENLTRANCLQITSQWVSEWDTVSLRQSLRL